MEGAAGARAAHVVVTGGMARSDLFGRLKADIGERTVWLSATEDSTALGAALLAELGLGWHQDARRRGLGGAARAGPEPGPGVREYRSLRDVYRSIYPALRALNSSIRTRSIDHRSAAER